MACASTLHMNAGLPRRHAAPGRNRGADGIGLFRTELQFMVSADPAAARPPDRGSTARVLDRRPAASPVVFRTLDSAATRCCPTCGRAARKTRRSAGAPSACRLDRPALLRTQVRALMRAAAGARAAHHVADGHRVAEFDMAASALRRPQIAWSGCAAAAAGPKRVLLGAMIEVPVAAVRARRADADGRFRLGRQQRPDAVSCSPPTAATRVSRDAMTRCRQPRCARFRCIVERGQAPSACR